MTVVREEPVSHKRTPQELPVEAQVVPDQMVPMEQTSPHQKQPQSPVEVLVAQEVQTMEQDKLQAQALVEVEVVEEVNPVVLKLVVMDMLARSVSPTQPTS
jgi:hypothetical protein